MNKKSVKDVNVKGKRCLVRVDFNVPINDGRITDETRINGALPTIKYLLDNGAKVILCSHMGKPHNVLDEKINLNKKEKAAVEKLPENERDAEIKRLLEKAKGDVKKYTLLPVANRLKELLPDVNVDFATDTVGADAKAKVEKMNFGDIVLLENTRFNAGEEKRDEEFCKQLASFCDVFVNDAFGTAHRSHASTAAIVEYGFVKDAVCGFLIEKELSVMAEALEHPVSPFVAILGGSKIADKLNVISNLLEKCDILILGGGMSYTFLKAQGYEIGTSIVDDSKIQYCLDMLEKAKKLGKKLLLPIDIVTTSEFPEPIDAEIDVKTFRINSIPTDRMGMDIGAETTKLYAEEISKANTVIWNGPVGVFENPILSKGTMNIARALSSCKGTTIIGGGDSAAAVVTLGFADKMTHISTGGGASLELFEGKKLPGIECLNDK